MTTNTISAGGQARMHVGDVHNTHTNFYTLRQRKSDETLAPGALERALLKASAEGQTRRVEVLIQQRGADYDYSDEFGLTALHHACLSGFGDTVDMLIYLGSDVNAYSEYYGTPICAAALKGRHKIIETLLDKRADLHRSGGRLGSPLHAACLSNDVETLMMFLDRGLPIDLERVVSENFLSFKPRRPYQVGETVRYLSAEPLALAAARSSSTIVEFLLTRNAAVHATCKNWRIADAPDINLAPVDASTISAGATALSRACSFRRLSNIQTLVNHGANVDHKISLGQTALSLAAWNASAECVEYLLAQKADIETTDKNGVTALMYAAKAKEVEGLKVLLEAGANVEREDLYGCTALHYAAANGSVESVKVLMSAGLSINRKSKSHVTLVYTAARYGNTTCLKYFLEQGAGPDVVRNCGWPPLHIAAQEGHVECVRVLLDSGADIYARDVRRDVTAEEAAKFSKKKGAAECFKLLQDARKTNMVDEYEFTRRRDRDGWYGYDDHEF